MELHFEIQIDVTVFKLDLENALFFGSSSPVCASQKYHLRTYMRKMFLSKYSSLGVNNKPRWSITCCDYGQKRCSK